jgi:lipopolysaccharide heptosyltransferase II
MENFRTILVFRFSSIGDIVQLSSPIQTLKDQFPNARLDVITLEEYAEILIGNPFVNRIIKISRNYSYNQLKSIGKKISLLKYDLIIDLHNVIRSKIILKHIKYGKKIIYKKPRWKRFKLVELKKDDFEDNFSQRWLYHQCLDTIFNKQYEIPNNKLAIKASEQREIKILLHHYEVNEPFITLIPGAAWDQKTWISERYSEVIHYLINHLRYKVIMLGGDNDNICNSISKINSEVIDLHGKLTLRESIALISLSSLAFGSDTGLMHASEAVGVPVAMIMGPTSSQMGGGVMLENSYMVEKDIWCRPCSQNGQRACFRPQQYCMNQISSSNVINAIKVILNK